MIPRLLIPFSYSARVVDWIKVDVEGAEWEILRELAVTINEKQIKNAREIVVNAAATSRRKKGK